MKNNLSRPRTMDRQVASAQSGTAHFYSQRCRLDSILAASVATLLLASPCPCLATVRVWTGNGADSNWSTSANWNPAGAPLDGDDLVFVDGAARQSNFNDLSGRRLNAITFSGTTSAYTISGNTVVLDNGFSCQLPGTLATVNLPVNLSQNETFLGGGGILLLNGDVDLAGHNLTLQVSTNALIGLGGVVKGTGDVIKTGTGSASFGGSTANTYAGTLEVEEGYFYLGKLSGTAVTGALILGHRFTPWTEGYVTLSQSHQIADSAAITINQGKLDLQGHDEAVGPMTIYGGDVLTGNGTLTLLGTVSPLYSFGSSFHPGISGAVYLPADVTFDVSVQGGFELTANVSGPGGIIKEGCGLMDLAGTNTFSGAVTIIGGTLTAYETSAAFAGTSGITLSGNGTLGFVSAGITNVPLTITSQNAGISAIYGNCTWAGPIYLNFAGMASCNTEHYYLGSAAHLSLEGSIHGTGSFLFGGEGQIELNGNNDYTGPTRAACGLLLLNSFGGRPFAGSLEVGGSYASRFIAADSCLFLSATNATAEVRWLQPYQIPGANLTLYANGLVNLNNFNEDFGPVTFNGGEVDTGTGQFAIYAPLTVNPAPTSAVINGYLGLPPGDNRVFIVGDGAADCDLLVNAVVFGSPGTYFVKQGAGTMCLASANTYNAPTLLEAGILDINTDAGLGTWPGLIIFDGATLRLSGAGNSSGGVELVGAGVGGTHGAVEVLPGNSFSFSGNILLDSGTTINVGGAGGALGLNGIVSGTGPLTKTGAGALVMGGGANNTYSGDTVVSAGSLLLARTANKISVPGNLVIGPGPASPTTFARLYQVGGLGGTTVSVSANSLFDLFGNYQSLTTLNLRDGGSVQTGTGLLDFPTGGAINVGSLNAFGSHASASITGAIGLPLNATLSFNVNAFAPSFPFASGPELDVLATIPRPPENLGFAPAGITKNGLGEMRLSGNNTYAGGSFINGGTLTVDGTQPQSPVVVNSGTLAGSGTVGPIYMNGGVVAPGDAGPGILTCSNVNAGFTASGVLRMELNGTTPGSGYDQLNVRGTVNLAGVALERPLGFSPPTGTQFDIISNDGSDAVTGTFNGLADGAKLYVGGTLYQINYRFGGKPGNDVALQGLDTPPPPTLTIQRLPPASVRLLWPTNDPPFSLQTTTNLAAASWTNALPLPVVLGTNNIVTNSVINAQQFYRLVNP
jgi:fibronectin-binding autotransporter adhesin